MTEIGELVSLFIESLLGGGEDEPECDYWRQNHKTDYNGPDSKYISSSQFGGTDVAFRLEARLASGYVRITSIFKWGTVAADVTDAQKRRTIRKFKAKVSNWGGRYRMKITDPDCGERTLPIKFRLLWSPDDTADAASHSVNLYKTYPRAGVTGWNVDIGYDSDVKAHSGWTLQHEYGHTICEKDEYFYSGVTSATVTYKKADGSSESVTLEPAKPNIMLTYGSKRFRKRFFYFAAIEAQELLRKESGHSVTCEIV